MFFRTAIDDGEMSGLLGFLRSGGMSPEEFWAAILSRIHPDALEFYDLEQPSQLNIDFLLRISNPATVHELGILLMNTVGSHLVDFSRPSEEQESSVILVGVVGSKDPLRVPEDGVYWYPDASEREESIRVAFPISRELVAAMRPGGSYNPVPNIPIETIVFDRFLVGLPSTGKPDTILANYWKKRNA